MAGVYQPLPCRPHTPTRCTREVVTAQVRQPQHKKANNTRSKGVGHHQNSDSAELRAGLPLRVGKRHNRTGKQGHSTKIFTQLTLVVISGSSDGTICVYDTTKDSPSCLQILAKHRDQVKALAGSPSNVLASAGLDGDVYLSNLLPSKQLT